MAYSAMQVPLISHGSTSSCGPCCARSSSNTASSLTLVSGGWQRLETAGSMGRTLRGTFFDVLLAVPSGGLQYKLSISTCFMDWGPKPFKLGLASISGSHSNDRCAGPCEKSWSVDCGDTVASLIIGNSVLLHSWAVDYKCIQPGSQMLNDRSYDHI